MQDSYIDSIWPVVGCLTKIEEALEKRFAWVPTNNSLQIASSLIGHSVAADLLDSGELLSVASESSEAINMFLAEYGSGQRIRDFQAFGPDGKYRVATGSRLDCQTEWKGEESSIVDEHGDSYQAFRIPARIRGRGGPYAVGPEWRIEIRGSEFDVNIHFPGLSGYDGEDIDVVVPCVSVKCDNDMSWLIGAIGTFMGPVKTLSGTMFGLDSENKIEVEQAVQTSKFEMSAKGAVCQAVAAAQFCLGTGCFPKQKRHIIVNMPFNMGAWREGYPQALMYGHLAQDSWKGE